MSSLLILSLFMYYVYVRQKGTTQDNIVAVDDCTTFAMLMKLLNHLIDILLCIYVVLLVLYLMVVSNQTRLI